jgi:hypothetical protein
VTNTIITLNEQTLKNQLGNEAIFEFMQFRIAIIVPINFADFCDVSGKKNKQMVTFSPPAYFLIMLLEPIRRTCCSSLTRLSLFSARGPRSRM